ncbi:MAG: hypothetical protein KA603_13590 [Azonexus sp.]|nr:hypothetical protein [Azonexus sp.]MBP6907699.1 hypothetical protein [Azonexus sp.]
MKAGLAVLLLAGALTARAEPWSFAVIGDTPYSEYEVRELPALLAAAAASGARFILHAGDIKRGRDPCDDAVYADRLALFQASPIPLVLAPGDNEWTDCARISAGAYAPEERLAQLRTLFWKDDSSLGRTKRRLERQVPDFPEHSRFREGDVLFVSLNVPGGDNQRGVHPLPPANFSVREEAIRRWLRQSFALARRNGLTAVVVLMQADPGLGSFSRGVPRRGFAGLLRTLGEETAGFAGSVLLIHGDGHRHRIDRPLKNAAGKPLLTRLETYGYPELGWVRVTVDPGAAGGFRFESRPWKESPSPQRWALGGFLGLR